MSLKVNLFIIGAMKSGTTTLHEYLNQHPRITMSTEKEPGYFVEELYPEKDESWYRSLFTEDSNVLYYGESSTHYAKYPLYKGVPERIKAYNPDARLIYIMRNPFDRLKSHYWHEVRAAHSGGEVKDIAAAIKARSDYLDFSNYCMQLEQYYEHFPKNQIYLVTFEELVKQPEKVTKDIFDWLSLPSDIEQDLAGQAFNAQPKEIRGAAGWGILNKIQYSKAWGKVSPMFPKGLKNIANKAAYKDVDKSRQEEITEQLRIDLDGLFSEQTKKLKEISGRDYPDWPNYN